MRCLFALVLAATVATATLPAAANDMATCFKGNIAPDTGIAACSRLIAGGKVKGAPLANALHGARSIFRGRATSIAH